MKFLLAIILCSSAWAKDGKPPVKPTAPTDAEKLAVTKLQLAAAGAALQMQPYQIAYQQARDSAASALAELGKKYGCEIDPQAMECKPPQPVKEAAKPSPKDPEQKPGPQERISK